jgi:ubiquinone/menaquinone biosynthesis C-methylase UbiE
MRPRATDDPEFIGRPTIPSSEYDTKYYLKTCAGFEKWVTSDGSQPDPLYHGSLIKARLQPGDVVVDIGTGRGEVLAAAINLGAAFAVGIEYSLSALALARKTVAAATDGPRIAILAADARQLPLPAGFADLVVMLDVIEHLTPTELHHSLVEARRILRPGGRLFAHTFPTRTIYNVTYRIQRLAVPGRRRRWPADPRNDYEHRMHVNEQTRRSLRLGLRSAGFEAVSVDYGAWVWDGMVPDEGARRLYRHLARFPVTKAFGVADLWAEATKPTSAGVS